MNRTFRIVLGAAVAIVIAILFGYVTGTLDPWLTRYGYGQWALKGGETSGESAQAPTEPGVTELPASSGAAAKPDETVVPIFDLVRVEPTGDAVIAGQGIPKAEIEILSGSSVIARGTANDAGEWAIVLTDPLRPGAHDLTVRAKAPGGETLTSQQSVAVSVPDGGTGEVLVVLNQPGTASTVLQVPGLEEAQKKLREAGVPTAPAAQPAEGGETTVAAAPPTQPAPTTTPGGSESFTIGNAPEPAGGETSVAANAPADAQPAPAAPAAAPAETAAPVETAAPAAPAAPTQPATAPAASDTFTIGEAPDTPAPAAMAPETSAPAASAPAAPAPSEPAVASQPSSPSVPAEAAPAPSNGESSATATADAAATPPAVADQGAAGDKPAEPVAAPAAAPSVPVTIQAVETENGVLYAAGLAAPGSVIRIYVDEAAKGEAKADGDGRWLLEQKLDLAPGSHKIRADHVGPDGSVLTRAEVAFEQAAPVEDQQVAGIGSGSAGVGSGSAGEARVGESETLIIRRGDNLWRIARRLYGRGVRYSTIYEANTDQIRDPDRIYPGQVFVLPKGDTNWQVVQP